MSKTYVLSGATGMIGRALIAELLSRGDRVIALVRPESRRNSLEAHENLTILQCGLSDYATYQPTMQADAFLHLAWAATTGGGREDVDLQLANIRYTLDAVWLAHRFGCTAFLGAGSQAEYGPTDVALNGSTPTDPQSGYGIAKYTAGKLSRTLCRQLGMRHNWARILSIYGEGDGNGTLIMYLIRTLLAGETPELTPCEQIWDYLYVADAARALLAIADRGVDGKVYPVGSGNGRPLAAYVQTLRDAVDPAAQVKFGAKAYYPHQPMYLVADISELAADTGFAPAVTFADGICRVIAWVREKENENG